MFYMLNLILPLFILLGSLSLILSASSWFIAWIALEMNMLAFLPMIISSNKLSTEAALKYFFVQVTGSIWVFFFMLYVYFYSSSFMNTFIILPFPSLILFALCLKLGAVPFHFWFPSLIEGLTWTSALILLTLQKLGPLSLVMLTTNQNMNMVVILSLLSVLVGSMSGLNQLMCRKLMSYSSISHLGWLLYASLMSKALMYLYYIVYVIITSIVILLFKYYSAFHMNQVFFINNTMIFSVLLFYLNFLSLGGLPPFVGFLPKWLVIKMSIKNMLIIIMVLSSIITLYFYLRLTYTALMVISFKSLLAPMFVNPLQITKYLILFPIIILPVMCFIM